MHINKIKTMYGLRYAVTEISHKYDKDGKKVSYSSAVEYLVEGRPEVAIFPHTEEGLNKARETRKQLMKLKK